MHHKFLKLAILAPMLWKSNFLPPIFHPFCKIMALFDFDPVKADVVRFKIYIWHLWFFNPHGFKIIAIIFKLQKIKSKLKQIKNTKKKKKNPSISSSFHRLQLTNPKYLQPFNIFIFFILLEKYSSSFNLVNIENLIILNLQIKKKSSSSTYL